MIGIKIENGFIDLAKTDFSCPKCKKNYSDSNDLYLNRMNRNKSGCTSVKCQCNTKFMVTYNMVGDIVTFFK